MSRQTSTYLDLARFLAAMVVFVGHTSGQRLTAGFLWQVAPFMGEAVAIFFVLSGFVIAYVHHSKETSAGPFALSRAARIYSVALPALALTLVLDTAGRLFRPDLYNASWGYSNDHQAWQFVSSTLFLNRVWFSAVSPGSDLPYWSLGYEVWYYVLFGIAVFLSGRERVLGMAAVLLCVGPAVAAMFPLWLIGVGCYYLSRSLRLARWPAALLAVGGLAGWLGYEVWARHHGRLVAVLPERLVHPDIVQDYLVGFLFACHLLGADAIGRDLPVPLRLGRLIRWIAGATFSLYLFHLPITQFLSTVSPWPQAAWPNRVLLFGGTMLIVFALAALTERKKHLWRTGLGRLARLIVPAPVV